MIRRTYKITDDQDADIVEISRDGGIDKEQVVQAALHIGLMEAKRRWEAAGKPKGLQFFRAVLMEIEDERINNPDAKRRSKR